MSSLARASANDTLIIAKVRNAHTPDTCSILECDRIQHGDTKFVKPATNNLILTFQIDLINNTNDFRGGPANVLTYVSALYTLMLSHWL